ncbi:uncharacterized protein [Parasteatoda tepidariorum]|uniref:uncharacterized protein n=1 Tax=Parasteatoda tepidariorum TaxID=114398 RepID=UPI0039BD8F96
MDKSDLYRFALLNHWRKEREKYPRPNPYEDGSEFDDEFEGDYFDLDEIEDGEENMMEMKVEVQTSDEVEDGEVEDYEIEDNEVEDDRDEEFIRDIFTYPTYLFTEENIAKLYKLDVIHDKDSIEYGIEDERLKSRDCPLREERDFWERSDIELTINEQSEQEEQGCFCFFSRMFRRLFKRK